jgi:hypothetical protein
MIRQVIAVLAFGALPLAASAQFINNVKVEPAEIKAGETAKITVNFDVESTINCGMRINWGDGSNTDYKINQKKDVPLVATKTYAKAGQYTVTAEPKSQGILSGCGRQNQSASLKVAEVVAQAPAAAAVAKAAGPICPADWTLDAKSVNRRSGAYTCRAKPGTKLPDARVACAGDLSYFENARGGRLGCRP